MSLQIPSEKASQISHKVKSQVKEYVWITLFVYVFYLIIETPWMLYSIDITFEQYIAWAWQGAILDLLLPYPFAKILQKYTNWLHREGLIQKT